LLNIYVLKYLLLNQINEVRI